MSKADEQREARLAQALRENLRKRKAQAREILPGTGRGTAARSGVEEGTGDERQDAEGESPLHQPAGTPPK